MGNPSFIIIGAMRSGTTALYSDICKHSKVRRALKKEINYYWRWHGESNFNNYLSYFPNGYVTGEASPSYMVDERCAKRIHDDFPRMKIIAILRNPVDRLWSHWWYTKRIGYDELPFERAIETEFDRLLTMEKTDFEYIRKSYARQSEYYINLLPYFQLFENILVLQAEKFYKERQAVVSRVFSFLKLEPETIEFMPYKQNDYPEMDENTRRFLYYKYVMANERLYEMIGERFDW